MIADCHFLVFHHEIKLTSNHGTMMQCLDHQLCHSTSMEKTLIAHRNINFTNTGKGNNLQKIKTKKTEQQCILNKPFRFFSEFSVRMKLSYMYRPTFSIYSIPWLALSSSYH